MIEDLCIVCPHVLKAERPVRLMIHENEVMWQAACGQDDHMANGSDYRLDVVRRLFQRQADLHELELLPMGQLAEWVHGRWVIRPFDATEIEKQSGRLIPPSP